MIFVKLNICMFSYRHWQTQDFVYKGLALLTNAPWLLAMGRLCDGSHTRTKLVGGLTTQSAPYNWACSVQYATQLKIALRWLRLLHADMPVYTADSNYTIVGSMSLTQNWPNVPLCYTIWFV